MRYILILDSTTWTRLVWVGTAGKVISDGLEGGGGAVGKNWSVVSSPSLKVVVSMVGGGVVVVVVVVVEVVLVVVVVVVVIVVL